MEKYLPATFISPGIASGKIHIVNEHISPPGKDNRIIDVEKEIDRFRNLVNGIADDLSTIYETISQEINPSDAEIVETHRLFILDQEFQENVLNLIAAEFLSAENAAKRALQKIADRLIKSKNDYLKQRADDLFDLIIYFQNKALEKTGLPFREFKENTIIVVSELFPSTVLNCKKTHVKGIIVEQAAPTSHAVILSKSFGIPVMVGFSGIAEFLEEDRMVILDSVAGNIILQPNAKTLLDYQKRAKDYAYSLSVSQGLSGQPTATIDGIPIGLYANIERLDELETLPLKDIDGIGLFRTEFLFMFERSNFPPLEQQIEWYRRTIEFMRSKPVTIRILDIGGDKFLPYFSMGKQENPYLGLRAHRVFRYHPELLEIQLQAIFETAKNGKVKILYPMVNTLEDLELFKKILANIRKKYDTNLETGIMIETPASVFLIEELLKEVDFVSIGTNDLVQYTLTVDRNNPNVLQHYKSTNPIIIKMLQKVIQAAGKAGKNVTVCGEIASDPMWIPLLIGLGIRELSIAPNTIYPIKQKIPWCLFIT